MLDCSGSGWARSKDLHRYSPIRSKDEDRLDPLFRWKALDTHFVVGIYVVLNTTVSWDVKHHVNPNWVALVMDTDTGREQKRLKLDEIKVFKTKLLFDCSNF